LTAVAGPTPQTSPNKLIARTFKLNCVGIDRFDAYNNVEQVLTLARQNFPLSLPCLYASSKGKKSLV
jgi:hypothetical protein